MHFLDTLYLSFWLLALLYNFHCVYATSGLLPNEYDFGVVTDPE